STARDFFASESARSFCWRVMAVFASLMSSRAAKAESAHKAGQAVARDIRIIDADFIRHLPWQANNQLRADFITNLAQWRIARRAANRRSRRYGWKVRAGCVLFRVSAKHRTDKSGCSSYWSSTSNGCRAGGELWTRRVYSAEERNHSPAEDPWEGADRAD